MSSASSDSLSTVSMKYSNRAWPFQMGDVVDRAGRQVVEDEHARAGVEQRLGQMGSDEARPAGDQRNHCSVLSEDVRR